MEGAGLQPDDRRSDDFERVTMKLRNEGRQRGKGMMTKRAKQTLDRQRIDLRHGNQRALIAAVPAEMASPLTQLAGGGFRKPIFLETGQVV